MNMLKIMKKVIATMLLLAFVVTVSEIPAISKTTVVQAAVMKISDNKFSLEVGKTKTLKVTGTTQKVTWSSGNKKIATVNTQGKVTAVLAGVTTITAKVGDKKLTCALTVTKASNPYLTDAPFTAEEAKVDDLGFVIPKDWTVYTQDLTDDYFYVTITPADASLISNITMDIYIQEGKPNDYEAFKEFCSSDYTKKVITGGWKSTFGDTPYVVQNLRLSDMKASFNKVFKVQYEVKYGSTVFTQSEYNLFIDHYMITLKAGDFDQMELEKVAEYLINSMTVK